MSNARRGEKERERERERERESAKRSDPAYRRVAETMRSIVECPPVDMRSPYLLRLRFTPDNFFPSFSRSCRYLAF